VSLLAEKLSQAEIDKLLKEADQAKEEAKLAELSGETITRISIGENQNLYICAYCKRKFDIKYQKVKPAPQVLLNNDKCKHWLLSADYLKALKSKKGV